MQATIIQIDSSVGSFDENVSRAKSYIENISDSTFVLLPELWAVGFMSFDDFIKSAQKINGELVTSFRALARKKKIHLSMGSFIESHENKFFNTSVMIDPKGDIIGIYRKIHLFTYKSREAEILEAGKSISCFEMDQLKFGMATCYDLRFPELFRHYVNKQAEAFIVPSAWPLKRLEHYRLFCQTRAIENLSFLFSANCCGGQENKKLAGHSMIVDPFGEIIGGGGLEEELITAKIDKDTINYWRNNFSALNDRKNPNFYE